VKHFKPAADDGDPDSELIDRPHLTKGQSVSRDIFETLKDFRRVAKGNNANAQIFFVICHYHAIGCPILRP
jgi:hypothetical protein